MDGQTQGTMTKREFEEQLIAKAWQNEAFKEELISNPKMVYAREFEELKKQQKIRQDIALNLPETLEIKVLEEASNNLYLILPHKPQSVENFEELTNEALETVSGGGSVSWIFSVQW
jgi:heme oxygenase